MLKALPENSSNLLEEELSSNLLEKLSSNLLKLELSSNLLLAVFPSNLLEDLTSNLDQGALRPGLSSACLCSPPRALWVSSRLFLSSLENWSGLEAARGEDLHDPPGYGDGKDEVY